MEQVPELFAEVEQLIQPLLLPFFHASEEVFLIAGLERNFSDITMEGLWILDEGWSRHLVEAFGQLAKQVLFLTANSPVRPLELRLIEIDLGGICPRHVGVCLRWSLCSGWSKDDELMGVNQVGRRHLGCHVGLRRPASHSARRKYQYVALHKSGVAALKHSRSRFLCNPTKWSAPKFA